MRRHSRGSGAAVVSKSVARGSDPMSLIRTFESETNPSRPVRPSPLASSQIQGMPLDLVDRIRSFPLFQSTPESFLAEVELHLRPQLNSMNDYILTEGDEAKAMYWLVRGAVAVTSRDGESVYAELKPGAFFGEIGVLMDRPRTATIIARTRCLLVVLTKEDFKKILPGFPEVEQAIREEAEERLLILEKKKKEPLMQTDPLGTHKRATKRGRDAFSRSCSFDEDGSSSTSKKRKSPSPSYSEHSTSSALANGLVSIRLLLKELPLFAGLPSNILHFLALNAQPRTYQPFTDIIRQGSQGCEIYFIVRGEVEVLDEHPDGREARRGTDAEGQREVQVKARLKAGQYFGEVVSLSLAPRRTATVRTVTSVECLMISGEILSEFWDRCPTGIREQIENTARERLITATDDDVEMEDIASNSVPPMDELVINENFHGSVRRQSMPLLTLTETELDSPHKPTRIEDRPILGPSDPDPFLIVGLDNVRSKSRRGSLAPIMPDGASPSQDQRQQSPVRPRSGAASPSKLATFSIPSSALPPEQSTSSRHADKESGKFRLNDSLLVAIFQHLELHHLLHLRVISRHWANILTNSPQLLHFLDLSRYNRKLTDDILSNIICPFVGDRPRVIDMNSCFHITDEGFRALANTCGGNLRSLKMKSVWDVTASAILDIASKAKYLQEIDLSNCRKVSDTLLTRLIGWTVPNPPFGQHYVNGKASQNARWMGIGLIQNTTLQTSPASGTVVGCPYLKRLALSYCKHVTDNSMLHIASHAAPRLEEVDLTRCTTITDKGFQFWGNAQFVRLRKLCLADCTYLTDNAIVYLTNAAKGLQELDLSFCCALSDTATEVLALGCPQLTHLNLSFCGLAVSDLSLRSIGLHLLLLEELSVRGCVRVTGMGVESVVEGCNLLRVFDVSQCKNLTPWLEYGLHRKYGDKIRYETVFQNGKLVR
ncbi:cyclic nucleotide-binding domain-containing protein [Histoplasma capsulatum H143]|uniref:Cyclic nucleotide-binding domain-containing protein n=1 Tax=Ajellomyces capsulatus (strain H143) TaxID=544712 RepID=C6H9S2_AJECH|nr:cyclic nucleotide-binding domain-containing protein [Histoplasma capsulatum H143]